MRNTVRLAVIMAAITLCASAQEKRPGTDNIAGDIAAIDAAAHTVTVKTEAGASILVKTNDLTALLRLPPGQTTLAGAATVTFADIASGDRVLARGTLSDDKSQLVANRLIVLSKSEIDAKHKAELDDWRKRGVYGVVKEVHAPEGRIVLEVRALGGTANNIEVQSDKAGVLRYAPGSLNFSDAKPSAVAEVKVGDQLRALGQKSADGKSFTAEKIVYGSFQTVGVNVLAVDAAKNEVKVQTLDKKKTFTLVVTKDSVFHRIPAIMAAGIARRLMPPEPRPDAAAGKGNGATPTASGAPPAGQGAAAQPASSQSASGQGGPGGRGPGGPGMDIQQMIDSLPNLTLADLKAGDVLAVASSAGGDETRVTAIKVVSGIDAVFSALAAAAGRRQQNVSLSSGLPSGFDFGAISP